MIDETEKNVDRLLDAAGLPTTDAGSKLRRLAGGANNRVYAVISGPERSVLKAYYRDGQPRLEAEFSFLELAHECGVDSVAVPLARDDCAGMALYTFLEGRRMTPADVNSAAVQKAASLFARVNEHLELAMHRALPVAAEACFSLSEHLEGVERRVMRLAELHPTDDLDELAKKFVADQLTPTWRDASRRVAEQAADRDLSLDHPIALGERCVSPSDFGFHNALLDDDGRISFLDFEYAGWDDPAKLICDFFCQLAVAAPKDLQPSFEWTALSPFPSAQRISERAVLLAPVYRVKWTCIVLNDFLAQGRARRGYALGSDQDRERRSAQLSKARELLDFE